MKRRNSSRDSEGSEGKHKISLPEWKRIYDVLEQLEGSNPNNEHVDTFYWNGLRHEVYAAPDNTSENEGEQHSDIEQLGGVDSTTSSVAPDVSERPFYSDGDIESAVVSALEYWQSRRNGSNQQEPSSDMHRSTVNAGSDRDNDRQ